MAQASFIRGQARSYRFCVRGRLRALPRSIVGVSLLAMRWVIRHLHFRPTAFVRSRPAASRLLRIRSTPTIACLAEIPCRSALARERGDSGEIDGTGQLHSRASALLQILCARKIACFAVIYCRSELARDAVGHSTSPFQTHRVRPIAARSKPAATDSEYADDCLLCRDLL